MGDVVRRGKCGEAMRRKEEVLAMMSGKGRWGRGIDNVGQPRAM